MNIVWIEDFGGGLDSGTATLTSMFGGLLSFENWDEDELSLLNNPVDLESFTKKYSSLHSISLCRHYFDYVDLKSNNDIIEQFDAIIIDIRLERGVDFSLDIPSEYQDKSKFHQNAGFYIFNDLAHLGFPVEKMCFMTGETGSLQEFNEQCEKLYLPKASAFEKGDAGFAKLRDWITKKNSDYTILRRGVIQGCNLLKDHIKSNDDDIQIRNFIKFKNKGTPEIEIVNIDMKNYLEILANFLPVRKPEAINFEYLLFLRTLVHEWEENIDPQEILTGYTDSNMYLVGDIHTFAWLSKMTRNWTSHANLLEPNCKIIAFLFLVNMRAMFKLQEIQPYENILLNCISQSPSVNLENLDNDIINAEKIVDEILASLDIKEINDKAIDKKTHFGKKINEIYRRNIGNPDAEPHDFKRFLLQYFWVNQKSYKNKKMLTSTSKNFLPTLARHIYSLSFFDA